MDDPYDLAYDYYHVDKVHPHSLGDERIPLWINAIL
jgi:hypothetical protein